jgi:hypothetical protein
MAIAFSAAGKLLGDITVDTGLKTYGSATFSYLTRGIQIRLIALLALTSTND